MEVDYRPSCHGSTPFRGGAASSGSRKAVGEHLAYDEGAADRSCATRIGNEARNCFKGDRSDSAGKDSESPKITECGRRSSSDIAEGLEQADIGTAGIRMPSSWTGSVHDRSPRASVENQATDDGHDSGPGGPQQFVLSSGESGGETEAECDFFPDGRRLGNVRRSLGSSLLSWTTAVVFGVTGRAGRLVSRVVKAAPRLGNSRVGSPSDRISAEPGPLEPGTLNDQTDASSSPNPHVSGGLEGAGVLKHKDFPQRHRKGFMRGVTHLAAVFLLEAATLGTVYVQWGGAWMNRVYGTVTPDIFEIAGNPDGLTMQAWKQGWLTMQPFNIVGDGYNDSHASEIIQIVDAWRPRLVVCEFPRALYASLCSLNNYKNGDKQKAKRLREKFRPYLQMCRQISQYQREH